MGKTELLLKFIENKKGIYLLASTEGDRQNIKIFKAIAIGCHTLGEICNNTGLDKSMVSKYIEVLKGLHIVREEIPVTASRKFKKRLYFISDPYFNFWFRYVYPNRIDLEAGRSEEITALVNKDFSDYEGPLFEILVDELIRTRYVLKQFSFSEIGRWWHKDVEIDIVGLNEAEMEIVFAECKWQNSSHNDAEKVLLNLQGKSKQVDWNIGKRKEYHAIFGKRIEGKDALRKNGFLVWDLEDYDR